MTVDGLPRPASASAVSSTESSPDRPTRTGLHTRGSTQQACQLHGSSSYAAEQFPRRGIFLGRAHSVVNRTVGDTITGGAPDRAGAAGDRRKRRWAWASSTGGAISPSPLVYLGPSRCSLSSIVQVGHRCPPAGQPLPLSGLLGPAPEGWKLDAGSGRPQRAGTDGGPAAGASSLARHRCRCTGRQRARLGNTCPAGCPRAGRAGPGRGQSGLPPAQGRAAGCRG